MAKKLICHLRLHWLFDHAVTRDDCDGEGWVCENHPNMPWREVADKRGCECGAGMPCKLCNPCDRNNPPRMMPGFKEIDPEDDDTLKATGDE